MPLMSRDIPRSGGRSKTAPVLRGFSLLELIVVMSVAVILAGILLPSLSRVRESVKELVCSSNLRQIGISTHIYARDHKDSLPYSNVLQYADEPRDLMAAHVDDPDGWDGLGRLFGYGYCSAVDCFYCPSHNGEHALEQVRPSWHKPTGQMIFTNYHYAGHRDWESNRRRRLTEPDLVLATDGLRSVSDFNHSGGMNLLRADGAVRWWEDGQQLQLMMAVAGEGVAAGGGGGDEFRKIWGSIQSSARE